jgi:Kef-type K+ transport system membrane component KefB
MPLALATAPPLSPDQVLLFLLQLGILLLLALCLGRLAMRVGLPAVVGELLTGVLLGPSLLGWAAPELAGWLLPARPEQAHLLDAVSQLAVLLLVGVTGAHLDTRMLRRRAGTVVRVSLGGLLIPLVLGIGAGLVAPATLRTPTADRATFAAFLGVALCVSAIPVIAKTLTDMRLLHRDVGQLTLSAATIDDAVGWFLLSLVSAMAVGGLRPGGVLISAAYLIGFVVLAALAGRPLVRLAMRTAGRAADSGPTAATAVIVILFGAAASQALALEAVFGAFIAGILVGSPQAVDPARLAPMRAVVLAVFAPIFLASAGLRVDLTALDRPIVIVSGAVLLALAVVGKFAGAYLGARLSRLSHWEGLALGAGLNARGVIQVVVATVGLRLGVLNTATYTIVVLVAVLTSVMAPPLLRRAMAHVEHSAEERLREASMAAWDDPTTDRARADRPADGGEAPSGRPG